MDDFAHWATVWPRLTPGDCWLPWSSGVAWTLAIGHLAIAAACFAIPLALVAIVGRRRDLLRQPALWLFAIFILLCGMAHWLDVLALLTPVHIAEAAARAIVTAMMAPVSVVAAIMLWRLLPEALALTAATRMAALHEKLRKSEQVLERASRLAGIGGWERDLTTGTRYWSEQTYLLYGVARGQEPTLEEALNFYAEEARPAMRAAWERAAAGGDGWDLELPFVRADGQRIWMRTVGSAVVENGRPVRMVGAILDVTARVTARIALKEANERVTMATNSGRIGIWEWNIASDRLVWDAWMYRLYGMTPSEDMDAPESGPRAATDPMSPSRSRNDVFPAVTYECWRQSVHPDDREAAERAVRDAVDGARDLDVEFRVVWNDGSVHCIRASGQVTRDATGRALRMVGVNWDISEVRRLLADAARAAELQAAVFRTSPDSLSVVRVRYEADGPTFTYEALSPAVEQVTGFRHADLMGRRPEQCLPPGVAEIVLARYHRCLNEGVTIFYRGTFGLPVGTRDYEGSLTPVRHPATGVIVQMVGAIRDVTERNVMERALRQSQKMEAIGQLSAGVAHDFNNILQSIVGGLELVLDDVEAGGPAHQFATVAINAAMRGTSLTHHLLSYARKQMLRPQAVEMKSLLAEMEVLLARTLGPRIAILTSAEQPAAALVDPGQLQTALLNLAINASHAMPGGGSLSMVARAESEAGQDWVVLTTTDTGVGMDEATLARAVDPFFTTKGLDGSGLGLSMVQGFVEQSGGRLRLASTPGQGTSVELRLPAAAAIRAAERAEPPVGRALTRVLLVDDAPDVLATTGAFLEKSGFTVARADGGDKALALLAGGARFDAMVSDYAMPGLNGAVLIAEARIVQPGLKAVLITGYAGVNAGDALPEGVQVLHKPFQRAKLVETLRALMADDAHGATRLPAPVDSELMRN